MVVGHPTWQSS